MSPHNENQQVVCPLCGRGKFSGAVNGLPEKLILELAQDTHQLRVALKGFMRTPDRGRISSDKNQKSGKELLGLRAAISRYRKLLSRVSSDLGSSREFRTTHESGAAEGQGRKLSPRERQIVQLLAESFSNKEIATKLGINVRTVETYRARIMLKLNLKSIAGLVRYAVRMNLI